MKFFAFEVFFVFLLICVPVPAATPPLPNTHIRSLADLSIPALRARHYSSELVVLVQLESAQVSTEYSRHFAADGTDPHNTYLVSYRSDGLLVYARIDLPAHQAPPGGFPVVVFVHGWVGREQAPDYDFAHRTDSIYARAVDAYVDAGYAVLLPGLRGHGQSNGRHADGIEYLDAWDNGSYLSTMFYAVDVLNLIEGLGSLDSTDWSRWGYAETDSVRLDLDRVHISSQSQGSDAALAVLAVSGEGSPIRNAPSSGSLWSGCFAPRFEQAAVYGPMANTLEAFMSGDGTWTGSAVGRDGSVNSNFVFAWPPDWIVTVDTNSPQWTWQAETWSTPSVAEALREKFGEMYDAVNRHVDDIGDAEFELIRGPGGKVSIRHDPRIASGMASIGGYGFEEFLTEPLLLHHSDQDYYSMPRWNADLARRINAAGGQAHDFTYPGNNHSLEVSPHAWFSGPGTVAGFRTMIQRDIELMEGRDPNVITHP